ncbi:MAG TPA: hypothetical protein VFH66_12975 [Mycobacteriales bacterium]|nr:hypothetical protein [Mycobacteriales bacterium]
MPTVTKAPRSKPALVHRRTRTSRDERRRGIRLLVISVFLAAAMFALWWLVATTNREGHHDAELLPLFTLFTLAPACYHLALARYLRNRGR